MLAVQAALNKAKAAGRGLTGVRANAYVWAYADCLPALPLASSRYNIEDESVFPSERVEAVMKSLEEKNKSIRFILGKKVGKQMRIVPELRFFVDDSLDYIDKIDELLK